MKVQMEIEPLQKQRQQSETWFCAQILNDSLIKMKSPWIDVARFLECETSQSSVFEVEDGKRRLRLIIILDTVPIPEFHVVILIMHSIYSEKTLSLDIWPFPQTVHLIVPHGSI